MGPTGGVRSCISDLLAFYNVLMDDVGEEIEINTVSNPSQKDRPLFLSQLPAIWTGWNILPMPLIREHSYGFGWLRAQLPSVLALSRGDPKLSPVVGAGAPSRLSIWHSGDIPGYQTHVTLFPENEAMKDVYNQLIDGRTRSEPSRVLDSYVGRYFNSVEKFFIEVLIRNHELHLGFLGREKDTFKLRVYGNDSFFWFLTHDAAARLARYDGYGDEFTL